jgi:hypothetical protein
VADHVLLMTAVGLLALAPEQVTEARRLAAGVLPPASNTSTGSEAGPSHGSVTETRLRDASEMSAATGVPASWFESAARKHLIPSHNFGRWVRFDYREVFEASRAGIPRLRDLPAAPVLPMAQKLKRKRA